MNSLSNNLNDIEIIGEYNKDKNRVYFHFINKSIDKNHIYTIYVNNNEITNKKIYLEDNDTNPVDYNVNIKYYINVDDFENNGIIDIKIIDITASIIVKNLDKELNGEYKFIDINYYKHDDTHILIKSKDTNKIHWTFMRNGKEHKYLSLTNDHTISPIDHNFTTINGKFNINKIKIQSTLFNINYSSDYHNYVNT